ncbi:MAG: JAB domain-containing protein [Clostridia bacterium]|nr:JAB domain-containing protein [Clostridia bacterium]MDY5555583.1 JAB domain-containing protein [Blautia sp.]
MAETKGYDLKVVHTELVRESWMKPERIIQTPEDALDFLADMIKDRPQEFLAMINLTSKLQVINVSILSMGTSNQAMVPMADIFRTAILSGGNGIVVMHNHPSGDTSPSEEDIVTTKRIATLGKMMGITLLDHVIIGGDNRYSFARNNPDSISPDDQLLRSLNENIDLKYGVLHDRQNTYFGVHSESYNGSIAERIPQSSSEFLQWQRERTAEIPEKSYLSYQYLASMLFEGGYRSADAEEISQEYGGDETRVRALLFWIDRYEKNESVPFDSIKEWKSPYDREAAARHRKEEMAEISEMLAKGVDAVFSSDKYREYLDTMSKFPSYSARNNLLIMMQKPEASLVQSYTGWRSMNRYVKKGEKGIRIIAPMKRSIRNEAEKGDSESGAKDFDEKNKSSGEKEYDVKVINGFKVVHTFDLSQTDGDPLPDYYGAEELSGDVKDYQLFLEALQKSSPVPIRFEDVKGEAKGFYNLTKNYIGIQKGMSELQTIKTALHEMTHAKLHSFEAMKQREDTGGKPDMFRRETEAESSAYIICKHYGLDTSDYSFAYIASWSKTQDTRELEKSLSIIQKTASGYIGEIDKNIELLREEKKELETDLNESVPEQIEKAALPGAEEQPDERLENGGMRL